MIDEKFYPKVSIIIPVYNGSNYLKEAIDSALAQTYSNVEIVVINDGSKDGGKTDKICKSYGNKIRYFVKKNGGAASALNMGIEKMNGDYFSWLSHDDVYYHEKIEKQIQFLSKIENNKNSIPYADYELIDKRSNLIKQIKLNHKELTKKPEYALLRGSINGITLLIPKKAFDEHGEFSNELKCTQDYDMWRRIMKTYKFVHMNEILTKTRIHAQQDSNKHPNVIIEGDALWIEMIKQISVEDKERLEGSEYNFYYEMAVFLIETPYRGALAFVKEKISELLINSPKDNEKRKILEKPYDNASLLKEYRRRHPDKASEEFINRNKFLKLLKLFKYQGVVLTLKKLVWKYGPKSINNIKRALIENTDSKQVMIDKLKEIKPLKYPNKKDRVSVILSSDANYEPHLWVTISSIIDNAKSNSNYYIYILDGGIRNKESFFNLVSKDNRFHLEFIDMKDQFVFVYESRHISRAGYYRLALFRLFKNFDRLIYIDADSYVLGDIAELNKLPMGNKSIAGAKDSITYEKPWREKYISYPLYSGKALGYFTECLKLSKEKLENYFSSGVLVFNLKEIDCEEKDRRLQELLLKEFYCLDQDIMNLLFNEKETYTLPREWNYFNSAQVLKPSDFVREEERENYLGGKINPKIISYVLKPWEKEYINSPYADIYWKKLESSPYYFEVKSNSEKNTKLNRFMRLSLKEKINFIKRFLGLEK